MNGVRAMMVRMKNSHVFFALLAATKERRFITMSRASSSLNSFRSTLAATPSSNFPAARLERRNHQMQAPNATNAERRRRRSPPLDRPTLSRIASVEPEWCGPFCPEPKSWPNLAHPAEREISDLRIALLILRPVGYLDTIEVRDSSS